MENDKTLIQLVKEEEEYFNQTEMERAALEGKGYKVSGSPPRLADITRKLLQGEEYAANPLVQQVARGGFQFTEKVGGIFTQYSLTFADFMLGRHSEERESFNQQARYLEQITGHARMISYNSLRDILSSHRYLPAYLLGAAALLPPLAVVTKNIVHQAETTPLLPTLIGSAATVLASILTAYILEKRSGLFPQRVVMRELAYLDNIIQKEGQ